MNSELKTLYKLMDKNYQVYYAYPEVDYFNEIGYYVEIGTSTGKYWMVYLYKNRKQNGN